MTSSCLSFLLILSLLAVYVDLLLAQVIGYANPFVPPFQQTPFQQSPFQQTPFMPRLPYGANMNGFQPSDYYEPQSSFARGLSSGFSNFPSQQFVPFESSINNGRTPLELQSTFNRPSLPPPFLINSGAIHSINEFPQQNHYGGYNGNINNGFGNPSYSLRNRFSELPFASLSTDTSQSCTWDSNSLRCVDLQNSCRGNCRDISGDLTSLSPQFHDCRCVPLTYTPSFIRDFNNNKKNKL